MDISSVSQASSANAASSATKSSTAGITSDFETFLQMLTTQMQNQDPLNPIDSTDYATQLATFSQVEQQVQTNDLLKQLVNGAGGSNLLDLAGWVGLEARSGAAAYYDGTAPVRIAAQMPEGAKTAYVVVRDSSGSEVARLPVAADADSLDWDGSKSAGGNAASGSYSLSLYAYGPEGGLPDVYAVESYNKIMEIRQTDSGAEAVLAGGTTVSTADISALRAAG